mmetsp:Transcript_12912/g.18993  ORF Transcript_12912/g.18993 Transcript_12912/m.18993 type:complete len:511 (-) Transcript_12912:118-1650(-)
MKNMKIFLFALSSFIIASTAAGQKLRRNRSLVDRGSHGKDNNYLSSKEFWADVDKKEDKSSLERVSDQMPQHIGQHGKVQEDEDTLGGAWKPDQVAQVDYNINDNDGDGIREEQKEVDESNSPTPPNDGMDDGMVDVRQIAKMSGLNLDDTMLLLKQQQEFSDLVEVLQDHENFLQTEMPSVPDGHYVVKAKGGAIPQDDMAAIQRFATNHANVEVKIVASRLSLKEAEDRAERISNMLEEMKYSQVSYSIDGDEVDISAKKPAGDKTREMGKIPEERTAEILGLKMEDTDLWGLVLVLAEYDDDDIDQPYHSYGGRKISGGGYQCTTAFSVIHSSGVTGTSTAAHCDGMTTYDAVAPEANYDLGPEMQHEGGWGDLQWHTTPHVEPAEYYARPTTLWPVRSVATSISKGEWVCSYSRMKGDRKCDRVFRTSVSVNYSCCPKMKRLVAMEHRFNIPGDSGGPWSRYDKAYGIVSGSKTICDWWIFGCNRRDVWSRVNYLGPALGVQVRTL